MANTTKTSKKSTIRTTTAAKKAATKKAGAKPVAAKAKGKEQEAKANGNRKDAVTLLRDTLSKTWPNIPTVEKLQALAPTMKKPQLLMYIGMHHRTMESIQRVGRLA